MGSSLHALFLSTTGRSIRIYALPTKTLLAFSLQTKLMDNITVTGTNCLQRGCVCLRSFVKSLFLSLRFCRPNFVEATMSYFTKLCLTKLHIFEPLFSGTSFSYANGNTC